MVDKKYINLMEKLISLTKAGEITWQYLDKNEELCLGMNWAERESDFLGIPTFSKKVRFLFDEENSFYTKIKYTCVVILAKEKQPADIFIVPPTYKEVIQLSSMDFGEYITRLQNLVKQGFPSAEKFIDDFLNTDEE